MEIDQDQTERAAKRLIAVRRFVRRAFVASPILIALGFASALLSATVGTCLIIAGFGTAAALMFVRVFIFPFLPCPRCRKPFFVLEGWASLLGTVNPFEKYCLHCELNIDSTSGIDRRSL